MTPTVAIFRKRLLSYTETFIADQGLFLPNYRPLFCGYHADPSGLQLLGDATRILLEEYETIPRLAKTRLRLGLGGAGTWINAIGEQSPSLIHAHFFNDGIDALKLGQRLALPVITTVHGHDITKHENTADAIKSASRLFDRVDRIIAVSDFIAGQALALGCPEQKLVQHYIGIDLEKFSQPKLESATPSLLFVGRLVEKKGCTYLLQAMEQLKSRHPDLHLTVIGEGELKSALREEASRRQLNVEFAGSAGAGEIRDRLARCWIFVAPSIVAASGDSEGLGMVFLEAQALQTPVVSFRSGGIVEAVEEGKTALLSDEKDAAGLARDISALLEDSGLRRSMGLEGRKRVERYFDVRKQCAELESIYAAVR
ncbi:MAG: glycosyltransferase [Gammaproteobacteria bacterium]